MDGKPASSVSVGRASRSDAVHNRAAILKAATALFAERGAANVSMDAIAERAGVGKPTLYRHFGDRAGLAHAVFEERERAFQEAVIQGMPPHERTSPPLDRIVAFLDGYLRLVDAHLDVLLAAETARPGARFDIGAYGAYRHLLSALLREAGVRGDDRGYLADLLLATTAAEFYWQQRRVLGRGGDEIRASAADFARTMVAVYAGAQDAEAEDRDTSPVT